MAVPPNEVHVPDFYQHHHGFPDLAEKVLTDVSFVSNAHALNQNPRQTLNESLGEDVIHVTTSCVVDDIMNAVGEDGVLENTEKLKCQHGTVAVDGTTCIRSVLGSFNAEKLVLATYDNVGLADEVKGLPMVVNAQGGGVVYLNPSPSQVAYALLNNPVQIGRDCELEKARARRRRENLRQRGKRQGLC